MFKIRKGQREDAQAIWDVRIQAILAQCLNAYSREIIEPWTSDPIAPENFAASVEANFFVLVEQEHIIATGVLDFETGRIDAIFVRPSHMRQGLGKAMMLHLERLATEHGLSSVTLDASLNAAPFYRALGYMGKQESIYKSPRGIEIACIPMVKRLGVAELFSRE